MKNDKERSELGEKKPNELRLKYSSPHLLIHGDIAKLTKALSDGIPVDSEAGYRESSPST